MPARTLPRYPLIIPSRPNAKRMRMETLLADRGPKPRIAYEIDAIASILDLVHEGFGYAILPLNSLRGHARARELVASPIVKPKLTIPMSLVVSSQRPATALTTALLRLCGKPRWKCRPSLSVSSRGGVSLDGFDRNVGRLPHRKKYRKARSATHFAFDFDTSAVLPHDRVRHRETEPRPLPDRLGREKRLEDPIQVVGRDTAPGIGKADPRFRS